MNYSNNEKILKAFYGQHGILGSFNKDNAYLKKAFDETTKLWYENFDKIKEVNYVMLAEAPLWGDDKTYFYNPQTDHTQFFYYNDLNVAKGLAHPITTKQALIDKCNEIGLLIVDISPFALNSNDTAICYKRNKNGSKKLTKTQYRNLITATFPTFFEEKIKLIEAKKSANIKVFFRYKRVKNIENDISNVLIKHGIIKQRYVIPEIYKQGGGIDRTKFAKIL